MIEENFRCDKSESPSSQLHRVAGMPRLVVAPYSNYQDSFIDYFSRECQLVTEKRYLLVTTTDSSEWQEHSKFLAIQWARFVLQSEHLVFFGPTLDCFCRR